MPTGWYARNPPTGYIQHWQRHFSSRKALRGGSTLNCFDVFIEDLRPGANPTNCYRVDSYNTAANDGKAWIRLGGFTTRDEAMAQSMKYMRDRSIMPGDTVLLTAAARLVSKKPGVTIHNVNGCRGQVVDSAMNSSKRFVVQLENSLSRYQISPKQMRFLEAMK